MSSLCAIEADFTNAAVATAMHWAAPRICSSKLRDSSASCIREDIIWKERMYCGHCDLYSTSVFVNERIAHYLCYDMSSCISFTRVIIYSTSMRTMIHTNKHIVQTATLCHARDIILLLWSIAIGRVHWDPCSNSLNHWVIHFWFHSYFPELTSWKHALTWKHL